MDIVTIAGSTDICCLPLVPEGALAPVVKALTKTMLSRHFKFGTTQEKAHSDDQHCL